MDCNPATLVRLAKCQACAPRNAKKAVALWLLCQWLDKKKAGPSTSSIVLSNGAGGFCGLIVDVAGNVGAFPLAGPATIPVPVLDDGVGGFWQIVTDAACNRGTTPVAGPATVPPVLNDAHNVAWTLVVDSSGNLGATS